MTVYLDLVMGLNFLVDLLLLTGANRLAGYPAGMGRAVSGAALGGIYGGVCLLPGFRFLGNLLWRGVSLALMSLLAFGIGPGTLRRGILFSLLSMALGGFVLALGSGGTLSLVAAAALVCAMCVLSSGAGAGAQRFASVQLSYGGKSVELKALHDTGNTLRDPVTGERVLIADPAVAGKLVGLDRKALLDPVQTLASGIPPGLRLIPYRSVGNPRGMLLGVRIRDARINGRAEALLVAFTPEELGQGAFQGLIGGTV